jgi:hypothetical protein
MEFDVSNLDGAGYFQTLSMEIIIAYQSAWKWSPPDDLLV